MIMLFRKDITKCCGYCQYADKQSNGKLKCTKKGVTTQEENSCLFYRYDPIKRIPVKAKPLDFGQYSEDDFKL